MLDNEHRIEAFLAKDTHRSAKPIAATQAVDQVIAVAAGVTLKDCYDKFMFWSLDEIQDFKDRGIFPSWWYLNPRDRVAFIV
jgi:hypothetical protein